VAGALQYERLRVGGFPSGRRYVWGEAHSQVPGSYFAGFDGFNAADVNSLTLPIIVSFDLPQVAGAASDFGSAVTPGPAAGIRQELLT
jgi:hypothetical protein